MGVGTAVRVGSTVGEDVAVAVGSVVAVGAGVRVAEGVGASVAVAVGRAVLVGLAVGTLFGPLAATVRTGAGVGVGARASWQPANTSGRSDPTRTSRIHGARHNAERSCTSVVTCLLELLVGNQAPR